MKPLRDNVLVVQAEVETTTASGLIISGGVNTGMKPGKVIAVGPDVQDVKVDDTVYLRWSDSLPVSYQGREAGITAEEKILAVE